MMIRRLLVAALLLPTVPLLGASRISFVRTLPAAHDLAPAERLAVIYAIGDTDKVLNFVEDFVDAVEHTSRLKMQNAVGNNRFLVIDEENLRRLRRQHPADGYLGVRRFSCEATERQAEGSERDSSGERVRRLHRWVDARCEARIDVMTADGKRRFSYPVKGEGTSPRSLELTADEREIAFSQAARYAALSAAEEITPRTLKETIELDETAPQFEDGFARIEAGSPIEARILWEKVLTRHPESAALHFDLAAVCEALGDLNRAREYLEAAVSLAPGERRFVNALTLFRKRNGEEVRTNPQ